MAQISFPTQRPWSTLQHRRRGTHSPGAYLNWLGRMLFVKYLLSGDDQQANASLLRHDSANFLCQQLCANMQFSPKSCDSRNATAARRSTGIDTRIVYSIGVRCFIDYFWLLSLPRSHQRRRCAALAPSSPPCSLSQVPNAVRAYIHCNHLQSSPTSAPAMAATLAGAVNPPWRITSLARSCSPSPDYPYYPVTATGKGLTAFTPPAPTTSLR
jgi:hypothetical protein